MNLKNVEIPKFMLHFFNSGKVPNSPRHLVYLGPFNQAGFDLLPWKTKRKHGKYKNPDPNDEVQRWETFVHIEELIRSSVEKSELSLTHEEKRRITEFAKMADIKLTSYGKNSENKFNTRRDTSNKKSKIVTKKMSPPVVPLLPDSTPSVSLPPETEVMNSSYNEEEETPIEVLRRFNVYINYPTRIKSTEGGADSAKNQPLNLFAGNYILLEIVSPIKAEAESSQTWLILEEQLPKRYGKSLTTWQQLYGDNLRVI